MREIRGRGRKVAILFIRCTPETWMRFRRYAGSFRNFEDALNYLLDQAERLNLRPGVYR